jgi:hypothetical protein
VKWFGPPWRLILCLETCREPYRNPNGLTSKAHSKCWMSKTGGKPGPERARLTSCYPRYLGITRRSCLEAHMVLDMEYREQERLEHGPGGPIFLLLSQLCPVSSTSFHHYRPGLASERTLAPCGNWSEVSWYVSYLIIITFLCMH